MNKSLLATFIIAVIILLLLRFQYYYNSLPDYADGQKVKLDTRISSEPDIRGGVQRFSVNFPDGSVIYVTSGKYPVYEYGQRVIIEGKLRITESNTGRGEGVRSILSLAYPSVTQDDTPDNLIMSAALAVRRRASLFIESVLSPVESALLLGIVFGIKKTMPELFTEQLQSAGVMHVIAASGMNVSMVAGFLYAVINRFVKRRPALAISMAGVVFYAFIAGLEPSIVRAAIMAGITMAAGVSGRQKMPLYALFLTAAIMLFISPILISSTGFQLSLLATLGILVLKPRLGYLGKRHLSGKLQLFKPVEDDFTTTLAAQAATLPVLLGSFGEVNILSVFINTLVLWTIPILMILGGIGFTAGLTFVQLGRIITYLTIPLLRYFEIVVIWFERVKLPLKSTSLSPAVWLGYYLVLLAAVIFMKKRSEYEASV